MVSIPQRTFVRYLAGILLVLTALSLFVNALRVPLANKYSPFVLSLFDADQEGSISNWYSSLLMLLIAATLAAIAVQTAPGDRRRARQWAVLAVLAVLVAIDEAVSIHEWTQDPIGEWLGTSGFLRYEWVIPATLLILAGAFVFRSLLQSLPRETLRRLLLGVGVFAGAAIGVELFEGFLADNAGGEDGVPVGVASLIQELFEGVGLILFLDGLITYGVGRTGAIGFGFTARREDEALPPMQKPEGQAQPPILASRGPS